MKKLTGMLLACAMLVGLMAGCSATPAATTTTTAAKDAAGATTTAAEAETTAAEAQGLTENIVVISREDGSGTRGAFIELMGVEVKDEAGNKSDMTTPGAVIANKTDVMLTQVAGNKAAIGYVSLGSLNDTVKALAIDGVEATNENVKNGSYAVARPFNIATKGTPEEGSLTADFIAFILSKEGQEVISDGYIPVDDAAPAYAGTKPSGKITVGGSSSVTPIMEKLKEAYVALNPNATIELQQSDSTAGMTSTIDGAYDIGMASRELKDSEKAELTGTQIAIDGIAVIVNPENPVSDLSQEAVRAIFTGETTNWADVK
ncbi:MAG: substrate-binding domain-containing protein [Christensenellaceae bacterium]